MIISNTYSLNICKCWCFWCTFMRRQRSNLFLFFMTKGCDNRWKFLSDTQIVFLLFSVYLPISYVQALSSYVFIAANVILHSRQSVQIYHLNQLLPPILPFLTSHHHSLRGFTQVKPCNLKFQRSCNLKFCWNVETEDPFLCSYLSIQCYRGCGLLCISKLQKMQSLRGGAFKNWKIIWQKILTVLGNTHTRFFFYNSGLGCAVLTYGVCLDSEPWSCFFTHTR